MLFPSGIMCTRVCACHVCRVSVRRPVQLWSTLISHLGTYRQTGKYLCVHARLPARGLSGILLFVCVFLAGHPDSMALWTAAYCSACLCACACLCLSTQVCASEYVGAFRAPDVCLLSTLAGVYFSLHVGAVWVRRNHDSVFRFLECMECFPASRPLHVGSGPETLSPAIDPLVQLTEHIPCYFFSQ